MLKKGLIELAVLAFVFFVPRFVCLYWTVHSPSAYGSQMISSREPSANGEGTWTGVARKIAARETVATSDDIGFPLVMAGLATLGVSYKAGFYAACLLTMMVAFGCLFFLHQYLKKRLDARVAWALSCYLMLYPPGVYFGFFTVTRMLPVYAFLLSVVLLLYADELFSRISVVRILLWTGVSLYAVFLVMARNTNKPIFMALVAGLAVTIFAKKINPRPCLVFVILLVSFYSISKAVFPPLEHTMWHPIYLGLGDFDNKYHIEMRDRFANDAARAANPALKDVGENIDLHPEYEPTLKKVTLDLIKNDPTWYARILIMRVLKITFLPFQGSWLMSAGDESIRPKDLANVSDPAWVYNVFRASTAVLDLALTFMGSLVLLFAFLRKKLAETGPYIFLLVATLHVYAVVMVSNRTIFLAGTYFYEFFAVLVISRLLFSAGGRLNAARSIS